MRFISKTGLVAKFRRFVSQASNVQESDVKDTTKLADLLRSVMRRVSDVEARLPPEAVEFEVDCPATGTVSISHNFGTAVRWYVTTWTQTDNVAYPEAGAELVQDATSSANTLVLRSYRAGRAVVRVEQSQAVLDPGITVAPATVYPTQFKLALTAQQATTSLTEVPLPGMEFTGQAGETWDVKFFCNASSSSAAGMKFSVIAPGGSTVNGEHYSGAGFTGAASQLITAPNTLGTTVHAVAGGFRGDIIAVRVTLASTGPVGIGFAKTTSGTATIAALASLIAEKVTLV